MNLATAHQTARSGADTQCGLRVAMLMASASRQAGGLFPAVSGFSQGLVASGCEVTAFGGNDSSTAEDVGKWGTVPVSVQQVFGPRGLGFQYGLISRLRAYRPDLVHVHGLWTYPSLATVRWSAASKPYVISTHGMLTQWALGISAWKKRIASYLYEDSHLGGAACLHALCDSERSAIRAYGLRKPVCVIPNGIEVPTTSLGVRPAWEHVVPAGAKVLLYLGRIHPIKGLAELLHGWGSAIRSKSLPDDWFLVIAGWDDRGHQEELQTLARDIGIDRRIRFVGPQFDDAKKASYERAQAFVLPSHSEGLPMAVLEAWAHGLPVLMTAQCNLPVGLEHDAALTMEHGAEDVARCLGELSAMSDDDRRSMGGRGRELAAARFAWSVVSNQMRQAYEWVLGGGELPPFVST